jgi:hypothetical protein
MNRYFFRTMAVLCIMVVAISCRKYLDKKSDSSFSVPTGLYDLQAMLDGSIKMNQTETPSFGEASADDYFLDSATQQSLALETQHLYTWKRDPYNYGNDWNYVYSAIYTANYCLEMVDKIAPAPSTQAAWNNVRGSALFFRSYNLLNIMWVHAVSYDASSADKDLGVVLRTSSDFNEPSKRSTVRECYDQIIKDAYESIDYLPEIPITTLRPSKPAAYGLLARAYLSMREYDSAYKYADLSLQIKSDLMDYNNDEGIDWSVADNSPFKQFNKETIFYTEMNYAITMHYSDYSKVDTTLYTMYSPNDLRRNAFYWFPAVYPQYKGSYCGSYWIYFTGLATDEMYLIRAEGHARAGRITAAMEDLNALLIKRWNNTVAYVPLTASDANDAIQKVLDERRKELYMRGLRWMDIKRLNKEDRNIVLTRMLNGIQYQLQPNSSYYALPLPADIIKLAGIPQN